MDYKKKCNTCPRVDKETIKGKLFCKELSTLCEECFLRCSDKRINCQVCDKYIPETKTCSIDGHYKSGNAWRICRLRGE